MEFKPSYDVYRQIIKDLQDSGKYLDFKDAEKAEEYVVMRHDVEFSIDRAFEMSKVESDMGFCSSYFVQITNNSYNALSKRSIDMMRDMEKRGHHIGLHYHLNGQTDPYDVRDGIRDQIRIMAEMTGLNIDRFSFHRPIKEVYYYDTKIKGIINTYSPEFFSYAENVTSDTALDVKYIADSKHRWNYGYPDTETVKKYPKLQILVHPFSWTESGLDNFENFRSLLNERQSELIETMEDEFQRFKEIRTEIDQVFKKQ